MESQSELDEYFDNVVYYVDPYGRRRDPGPIERWRAWWELTAMRALERQNPLAEVMAKQGFVVTTEQAEQGGFTRSQRRTRIGNGVWTQPHRGMVAPLQLDDPDRWVGARRRQTVAATAAAVLNPGHVICGRSAAVVHGVSTFRDPIEPMLTSLSGDALGRRGATHARGAALRPHEITTWFGVPVTTLARTIVDLARHDRWDAIIAADAALHERVITHEELTKALDTAVGWPGVRQARAILALARHEAESPLESLIRLRLHDDDFPPPELQVEITVPGRSEPLRVDFLWREFGLVLEADGLLKYVGDAGRREKRRDVLLGKVGLHVEHATWDDAVTSWATESAHLRSFLRRNFPSDPWR